MNTNGAVGRAELKRIVSEKTGLPMTVIKQTIEVLIKEMSNAVRDDRLHLRWFGTFYKIYIDASYNTMVGYMPARYQVKFKYGRFLRDVVNHEREVPPVFGLLQRDYSPKCKKRLSYLRVRPRVRRVYSSAQ
jgi:nucleoid DNA-binding protein